MSLIKIINNQDYIDIQYIDGINIVIRKSLIGNVLYRDTDNEVTLVEHKGNTLSFNYKTVENPLTPNTSFFSVYALWVYIMNMMGASISIPVPPSLGIKYGRLYNWYAASNPLFAPIGWHVPNASEFDALITFLGGEVIAGGKCKETGDTYWSQGNIDATNEALFNGRGSGSRDLSSQFSELTEAMRIWTSELRDILDPFNYLMAANSGLFGQDDGGVQRGYCVRPIKDDSILVPTLTDLDGNSYRTTKIGNQVWLADNWACTKLNNGTPIPNVTDNTLWANLVTAAYCNYNNDISNVFLP